jgi:hypothetical protein
MATTSTFFSYSLTLHNTTATTHAIQGRFYEDKQYQIVAARGSILSLYALNRDTLQLSLIAEHNVFSIIQRLAVIRMQGMKKGKSFNPEIHHEAPSDCSLQPPLPISSRASLLSQLC